ncbi:MAG: YfbK domain-containing protein [Chitinophagaceae bacterium]
MKRGLTIFFFCLLSQWVIAQEYYIRGEVRNVSGNPLQNVQIRQSSTGLLFRTGTWGSFGFSSRIQYDSLQFSLEGYRTELIVARGGEFLRIILRPLPAGSRQPERTRLTSRTSNMTREEHKKWFAGEETYATLLENNWVSAANYPTTGLSLNVDQASYSNIRRFLSRGTYVPTDAVRVEEILNYFSATYKAPSDSGVFAMDTRLSPCPWNWENQLLQVDLSAKKLNLDSLPSAHLVFLIDISASMDMPNRLPLLQSGFRMLISNLREKDSVSIVVYGGMTAVLVRALSGCEKDSLTKVINGLVPGGATPGESGIRLAYQVAKQHFIEGGNNRVILATDGDFNVGLKTETELDELISIQRQSGIYLTCLGVGMGNYKDSKIQLLAEKGNGNFAYLDQEKEAERVLMKEFTKTLYAVADDVYMNITFDPAYIKNYRLIGFDNKVGALLDSLSQIEGGEIGSGHTVTALFEIEPSALLKDKRGVSSESDSIASLAIQYRLPSDSLLQQAQFKVPLYYAYTEQELKQSQFSAALAQFGMFLKGSTYVNKSSWNELLQLGEQVVDPVDPLQLEWVELVKKARELYDKKKKRSWKRLHH